MVFCKQPIGTTVIRAANEVALFPSCHIGIYTSRNERLLTLAPLSPSRTQVVLAFEMGRGAGGEGPV